MKEITISRSLSRKLRLGARWVVLSTCLTQLAGPAQAGVERPFQGTFHGFAEAATPTDVPEVVEISIPLAGQATHLGKFDMVLVHHLNVVTLAFTGHTEWTAANGDRLYTTFIGQAYPSDDPAWITFDVTHTITGGTGRFEEATGTFEGVGGRFNVLTGEDVGGYAGRISY